MREASHSRSTQRCVEGSISGVKVGKTSVEFYRLLRTISIGKLSPVESAKVRIPFPPKAGVAGSIPAGRTSKKRGVAWTCPSRRAASQAQSKRSGEKSARIDQRPQLRAAGTQVPGTPAPGDLRPGALDRRERRHFQSGSATPSGCTLQRPRGSATATGFGPGAQPALAAGVYVSFRPRT